MVDLNKTRWTTTEYGKLDFSPAKISNGVSVYKANGKFGTVTVSEICLPEFFICELSFDLKAPLEITTTFFKKSPALLISERNDFPFTLEGYEDEAPPVRYNFFFVPDTSTHGNRDSDQ